MKKLFHIVFATALLLGAVSCTDLLDEALRGRGVFQTGNAVAGDVPEGARLTLGFNVPMPVATKAMTEDPTIDSIHVFVFSVSDVSENGAFLEVRKATLSNPSVNKNAIQNYDDPDNPGAITNASEATVIGRWDVDLMMGRGKRHIHFVANLPEDFEVPDAGTDEASVLRSIQTSGGDVAYWQMVEVENGILAYTYQGEETYQYVDENGIITTRNVSSVPGYVEGSYSATNQSYSYKRANSSGEIVTYDVGVGDYITTEGLKVLDGGGYYASIELSQAVNLIPLIRNFARIKVMTPASSNFRLKKAVLINTPEKGFAAPYDDASHKFVEAYRKAGTIKLDHATIQGTGYPATIPGNSIVTTKPDESTATDAVTEAGVSSAMLYMYERGIPTQKATGMLVYGTLTDKGDRWFKVEIADKTGAFFPIYRDFTYEVSIESINGSEGYETMDEAWENDAIGDISGSPETQTLTKIDDGQGLTLWVEYIDHTSTDPANHSVRLLYKFYKGADNYTDRVTLPIQAVTGREPAINSTAEELTGSPYSGTDTPDGGSGWYAVDVPLYGNSSITKVSTLHVEGKLDAKTMYRDITYRVMSKQDFTLSNTGLSADALNATTTLNITLPDYLGYSVFPLTLMIEAENKNLNPADGENLSVGSGTSLFDPNKNSFYFLKTIEYDDYQANHTVPIAFKTTQASGNATWIAVADKEGYFNTGKDYVSTGPIFLLSANTASVGANETSTKFTLYSTGTENPDWTLSADNTNVTFLPGNTGTGSKAITVRFPANDGTTAKTYTVTASRTGQTSQTFTITQRAPEFSLSAEGTTIGPDAATVSFDITSTSTAQWTVSTEDAGVTFGPVVTRATTASINGRGNATISVLIPKNEGTTDIPYVITAQCEALGITRTFTITQRALTFSISADSGSATQAGWNVSKKASETTASFTVTTNSNATWTISTSASNVTAVRSGSNVNVTFPDNLSSDSPITRWVDVTIGNVTKRFTITQAARQLQTVTGQNATFNPSNFTAGTNSSLTVDYLTVTFSRISNVDTWNDRIQLDKSGTYTVTITPNSTNTVLNVTITNITVTFRNRYTPSSVTGGLTLNNNNSATYSGSSTNNITASITTKTGRNDNATQITGIEVTYSYQYYD